MKIFKKIILIILGIFLLGVVLIAFLLLRPDSYLPHKKIQISLPFDPSLDTATRMIPMGEKMFHPDSPLGHPGIDFQWETDAQVISSSDGKVANIEDKGKDGVDVYVNSGAYKLVYKELDKETLDVKKGQMVKTGDKIGRPSAKYHPDRPTEAHYQVHWEFASISLIRDRFCPMTYFDNDSAERIEKIWATIKMIDYQSLKTRYPDICSGDYKNRVE